MEELTLDLGPDKKVYFASDFHLGAPDHQQSLVREKKVIRWLASIENSAAAIFLVGDIFDFWFEYKHVIPKGHVRFQGKLAEICDKGIPIFFFHGNHDMWMKDYFQEELGIRIYENQIQLKVNSKRLMVGHGDGLGPGDSIYKLIKKVFRNKIAQWAFKWLHPNLGMALAHAWSSKSRIRNNLNGDPFKEKDEWLFRYCKEIESNTHHDYYIFGHRHLPLNMPVSSNSHYINLGEWIHHSTYAVFDGHRLELKEFEG